MEIVEFYTSDNRNHWLNEIKRSDYQRQPEQNPDRDVERNQYQKQCRRHHKCGRNEKFWLSVYRIVIKAEHDRQKEKKKYRR